MEPAPRHAFQPGTFGSSRAMTIPLHVLDARYTPSGIRSAKLNEFIIRMLNTYLGATE